MSKRYGRNQRREHLARIAHLEDRLLRESTAHLYTDVDGLTDLKDHVQVMSYYRSERGGHGELCRREAEVEVYIDDLTWLHELVDGPLPTFQFMGHKYLSDEVRQDVVYMDSPATGRRRAPSGKATICLKGIA